MMELFWLFALAGFFMKSTAGLDLPFMPLLASYGASFALAGGLGKKNLRVISVIFFQILLFSLLTILTAWWVAGNTFLPPSPDIYEWYGLILVNALTWLFFHKGKKLGQRQISYKLVCNYFDLGLGIFFGLLLIRLLVYYHSGIRLLDPSFPYLFGGFLLSGLLAIFFSNAATTRNKEQIQGYRGISVIISFGVIFLFSGAVLAAVLMPFLSSAADTGYTLIKAVSGPMAPYLIRFLRIILVVPQTARDSADTPQQSAFKDSDLTGMAGSPDWFSEFLLKGLILLIFAAALILCAMLALILLHFLFKKTAPGPSGRGPEFSMTEWIKGVLKFFFDVFKGLAFSFFSGPARSAQAGFLKLMAFGRKSGLKRHAAETPLQYVKRLQNTFSPLDREIASIIHAFHLETYGETQLSDPQLDRMNLSLKKIHRPSFFLMRVLTRIRNL